MIELDRIECAARIYSSNDDTGRVMGITPGSFGRGQRSGARARRYPASSVGTLATAVQPN